VPVGEVPVNRDIDRGGREDEGDGAPPRPWVLYRALTDDVLSFQFPPPQKGIPRRSRT